MKKPVTKKTYRVLEVVESGKHSFFPQQRVLYFFWKKLVRDGYEILKEEFNTLEAANEFLYNRHKRDLTETEAERLKRTKKKDDTKETHSFDAVFYKLKK